MIYTKVKSESKLRWVSVSDTAKQGDSDEIDLRDKVNSIICRSNQCLVDIDSIEFSNIAFSLDKKGVLHASKKDMTKYPGTNILLGFGGNYAAYLNDSINKSSTIDLFNFEETTSNTVFWSLPIDKEQVSPRTINFADPRFVTIAPTGN